VTELWTPRPDDDELRNLESSVKLAAALHELGFVTLAERARRNEFHDYFAPEHEAPQHALVDAIWSEWRRLGHKRLMRLAARDLERRVKRGEFDATDREADLYAKHERGQADARALLEDFIR
jgi:hypothetical protein